jgi:hypothetical protein
MFIYCTLTVDIFLLGQLRLTTTHYVFDENLSIIFAKNLRPGKTKILVSDDNNSLVPVFVDDVTNVSSNSHSHFQNYFSLIVLPDILNRNGITSTVH